MVGVAKAVVTPGKPKAHFNLSLGTLAAVRPAALALWKRVLAASDHPFEEGAFFARGAEAEQRAEAGMASAPEGRPRYFAMASRWPGARAEPMARIFPVSSAARTDLAVICRSVSGSGAPAALPALWQFTQLD